MKHVIAHCTPFTFCCPQAIVDQDAGVSIPNISLLPLDEVPVHVHPFAARAPCDSKGSECQCGIHTAETSTSSRSLSSNSTAAITSFPCSPNSPPRPAHTPHPAPSAPTPVL